MEKILLVNSENSSILWNLSLIHIFLTTDKSICLADLEQDLAKTFLGKYGIRVE